MKKLIAILLLAVMVLSLCACNPTRRGQTNRCTICGSSDVYYSSGTYGYCEEHFNDMLEYGN